MMNLVLTFVGPDRPGLVEALAHVIKDHDGNWLESRMARLAGQFAGILQIEAPADADVERLRTALRVLESEGLVFQVHRGAGADEDRSTMTLELTGHDRPGIVHDVARVLSRHRVNIEELVTDRYDAPMGGGLLFAARARVHVPQGVDPDVLRREIEKIAHDLMVEIELEVPLAP